MADPNQTPVLPSTADATPYVPISWMAVAAAVVSGSFVFLLVSLGAWDFFLEKKPLLIEKLLILPVIGVVLSFAARRLIRNSEGTRTGEKLANAAWWGAVVAGLGYSAYFLAIDYSIHRDAALEARDWIQAVLADDPKDPVHKNLNQAFIKTIEPDRARNLSPENLTQLEVEFREQYAGFKQCDLVRIAHRNVGQCNFEPGTVKDWLERPNGVECTYTGTLKCPEGMFPLQLQLRSVEGSAASKTPGRKWVMSATASATGLLLTEKIARTPYGWMVEALEQGANMMGRDFFYAIANGPVNYPIIYHNLIQPDAKFSSWPAIDSNTSPAHSAIGGNLTTIGFHLRPEYSRFFRNDFFKLPGGDEPSAEQKEQFLKGWDILGLLPPGLRLKNNADKASVTTVTDSAFEVRIPCEMVLPGQDGGVTKCRLVVSCTDPALLAELKQLRSEADPSRASLDPPANLKTRESPPLRITRVETDLRKFTNPRSGPGGGPNPQMPSPMGMGPGQ
jgi:hypothetical protein